MYERHCRTMTMRRGWTELADEGRDWFISLIERAGGGARLLEPPQQPKEQQGFVGGLTAVADCGPIKAGKFVEELVSVHEASLLEWGDDCGVQSHTRAEEPSRQRSGKDEGPDRQVRAFDAVAGRNRHGATTGLHAPHDARREQEIRTLRLHPTLHPRCRYTDSCARLGPFAQPPVTNLRRSRSVSRDDAHPRHWP